jgi:hypothetical protein
LQPGAAQDIDPKQPPWYHVKDVRGGLYQHDLPPDSVMQTRKFISHRSPPHGSLVSPEFPLEMSWRPANSFSHHQLQIRNAADKVVIDTQLASSNYLMPPLEPRATYKWRIRGVDIVDSTEWMSWWTFSTDKLDRVNPIITVTDAPYSRTVIVSDTGVYASGIKTIEVQANNDSEARILPSRLVKTNCHVAPDAVTIKQIDTLVTIKYAVILTDCEDNTTSFYDSIPAHTFIEPARVIPFESYASGPTAYVIKRGEHLLLNGAVSNLVVYDITGKTLTVRIDHVATGLSLHANELMPGAYTITLTRDGMIQSLRVLVRP